MERRVEPSLPTSPPDDHRDAARRSVERTPRETGMSCPNCQGDDRKLYRVPVVQQLGSVPIATACFFCYIKITGNRPPSAELVPGSGAGSNA